MKTLYIVDASGYLYRSYFAIRNITNSKGESTNALFGFLRSVMKLRKDFNPDHLVCIFDGPHSGKTRETIYSDYKAHRAETPKDLGYQIDWARKACELMGIPYLVVPEVEADDTMGSVAVWAAEHGITVYLCTSDKDLYQFVNDKILILNTFKENQILGPKEVEDNFGVPPEKMIDLLAMMGDTSDNVPGLPGIGPKTAAALLKEHGTLDYILDHPEVVSGKKRETIEQFADQARLSRKLVTIDTEVDFPKKFDFFAIKPFELDPLKKFYAEMNFNTLIRELDQQQPIAEGIKHAKHVHDEVPSSYTLVDDEQALSEFLKQIISHKEIAVSTLGTQLKPFKSDLVGISLSVAPRQAWYIPTNGHLGLQKVLKALKGIFENPQIQFFGHNIKYDIHLLGHHGITIANVAFDSMLASYLLNSHSRQHTLDHLMLDLMGKVRKLRTDILGKGKSAILIENLPPKHIYEYCCEAADYTYQLKVFLEPQLKERKLYPLLMDLELPLIGVLAKMERHGIYLDIPYLDKMSKEILHLISHLEHDIYKLAGEKFNINSPKQLSEILFTKMGIKAPKKTATGLSTNADVLESLAAKYPIASKLMEYRTLEKLRSTYIDTLPMEVDTKTHRIHCTFNQSVAATGRLSCQDPNLQNIPIRSEIGRKIRGAFRPAKSDWSYLAADYSQIELRLLAHLSEDPHLIKAFKNGEDIHASTAAHIFGIPLDQVTKEMRYSAKAVNFGVIYGQQAFGLSQELGIEVKQAAEFIQAYFHQYKRVKEFVEETKELARKTGRAVTYTGRERLIPEIHSKNGILRSAAERLAINTPLQGTAADLIKMAMLEIDQKLKKKYHGYMILQIHDELIFEVPDEEISEMKALVRETMEGVMKLKIPLVVDVIVGKNWSEC